jgi:hypothetical protein
MTQNYESKKDGKIFTLVGEVNAEGRITLGGEDGVFTVTESTLKRWYKPTDKQTAVKETKKETAVATLERPVKVVEGIKLDPQEFKGEVSKKPEPKTDKETKKRGKTEAFKTACDANSAMVTGLLQYGQKQGCEIIAHQVDTVLRYKGKNIMMAFVRKATATMCFNYLSIPADIYGEIADKVTVTPDDWKKTLDVWVKVTEDNQKIILDLIHCGIKYIDSKYTVKENGKVEKVKK